MKKYVYIAFCDEIIFFRTHFGQTDRQTDTQTDRKTDIVVYREVTLPKIIDTCHLKRIFNFPLIPN